MDSTEIGLFDESEDTARKPRIAFMGEFSAGKSTLSNLLIGASPLPMKVTATQLPPVWVAYGDDAAYREDLDGTTHPLDLEEIGLVRPDETRVIRVFQKSDILQMCDLIDMPGISDPNMSVDLWRPVAEEADAVIWCTHATQAWRQSEAAMWAEIRPDLHEKSLLLVTRFDKLLNDTDRARVLRRVKHETEGMFAGCYPISLTQALAAKDDRDLWEASGAEAFMERLVELLHEISHDLGGVADNFFAGSNASEGAADMAEDEVRPRATGEAPRTVTPRRVTLGGASGRGRRARPDKDEADDLLVSVPAQFR